MAIDCQGIDVAKLGKCITAYAYKFWINLRCKTNIMFLICIIDSYNHSWESIENLGISARYKTTVYAACGLSKDYKNSMVHIEIICSCTQCEQNRYFQSTFRFFLLALLLFSASLAIAVDIDGKIA